MGDWGGRGGTVEADGGLGRQMGTGEADGGLGRQMGDWGGRWGTGEVDTWYKRLYASDLLSIEVFLLIVHIYWLTPLLLYLLKYAVLKANLQKHLHKIEIDFFNY